MKRVFCFGELLMRFSPDLGGDWLRKHSMVVYLGGSELNVATALAAWNIDVEYCTALPQHKLSEEILRHLVSRKLGTSSIYLTGGRIGSYYLPTGTDLHTAVIYDRSHSSFSELVPGKIDWEEVLKDIDWFHFSALSPSLNRNVAAVCREALEVAFRNKIIISVDLNYRPKLWQYGKLPFEIMPSLVHYCNIIMGNIWAAEKMLDISLHIKENGKIDYLDLSEDMSKEILKRYPNCHQVANTFRFTNDGAISYFATLRVQDKMYISHYLHGTSVKDKVGSGDAFMAGLIYGNLSGYNYQTLIDFAADAAFTKLFIKGDSTTLPVGNIIKKAKMYV